MVFEELISLFLYALQQLGVMLGVGAETIILLAYLITMRDGVVEKAEERFARAVNRVLHAGLILIVTSGVGIVIMHFLAFEFDVLFAPVFLFKWVLVGVLVVCAILVQKKVFSQDKVETFAGGTWYALFIVHILAPITTWTNLVFLYALWMVGFSLCWYALTRFTLDGEKDETPKSVSSPIIKVVKREAPPPPKSTTTPTPTFAPTPTHTPRPAPPSINLPIAKHLEPLAPKLAQPQQSEEKKPEENINDLDSSPFLPAIRIMPKTPEDVEKQNRATVVTFG